MTSWPWNPGNLCKSLCSAVTGGVSSRSIDLTLYCGTPPSTYEGNEFSEVMVPTSLWLIIPSGSRRCPPETWPRSQLLNSGRHSTMYVHSPLASFIHLLFFIFYVSSSITFFCQPTPPSTLLCSEVRIVKRTRKKKQYELLTAQNLCFFYILLYCLFAYYFLFYFLVF